MLLCSWFLESSLSCSERGPGEGGHLDPAPALHVCTEQLCPGRREHGREGRILGASLPNLKQSLALLQQLATETCMDCPCLPFWPHLSHTPTWPSHSGIQSHAPPQSPRVVLILAQLLPLPQIPAPTLSAATTSHQFRAHPCRNL